VAGKWSSSLYGLFLGLGVGILASILVGIVGNLTFGGALLICALPCAITGAVVGAIMTPQNLLSTLAARIPDNHVFPGFIFVLFLGGLLALHNAPNIIRVFPAQQGAPSDPFVATIVLGLVTLFMLCASIWLSRRTIVVDSVRLTAQDIVKLVPLDEIKRFARHFLWKALRVF